MPHCIMILLLAVVSLTANAGSTTKPAVNKEKEKPVVLVVPFYQQIPPGSGPTSQPAWLEKPLAMGLSNKLDALPPATAPTTSVPRLMDLAKTAKANLVIYGSFKMQDESLKLNLQLLDVKAEKTHDMKTFTYDLEDLFSLEDEIAATSSLWIERWKEDGLENTDDLTGKNPPKKAATTPTPAINSRKLHPWEVPDDEILAARMRGLNNSESDIPSPAIINPNPNWRILPFPNNPSTPSTRPAR